ncbi:hypothetical protein [Pseudomonas gingeri]|uniref:Uncharacterized protein n=1 Tax=Pseudomonas gingeri TaxID=117681 RepID=A0A7Y8CNB5_9PSED|nr:hypothetical protein [Pseudomonas gingeri]NWB32094.1 hypothetical protein [Pseudomonas gingeri]NWC37131.1 hypothetical protein [Pseudomonas gingeri]
MVAKIMKPNLKEMAAIAQKSTLKALEEYRRPEGALENLILGSIIDEHEGVFELYIAGETSKDAKVISCAKVDQWTKSPQK